MSVSSGHVIVLAVIMLYLSSGVLSIDLEWSGNLLARSPSEGKQWRVNLKPLAEQIISMPLWATQGTLRVSVGVENTACGGEAVGACITRPGGKYETLGNFGDSFQLELNDLEGSVTLRTSHPGASSDKPTLVVVIKCYYNDRSISRPTLNEPMPGNPHYRLSFYNQAVCKIPVAPKPNRCGNTIVSPPGKNPILRAKLDTLAAYTEVKQSPLLIHNHITSDYFHLSICNNYALDPTAPEGAIARFDRSTGEYVSTFAKWPPYGTPIKVSFDYNAHSLMGAVTISPTAVGNATAVITIFCDPLAFYPIHLFSHGDVGREIPDTAFVYLTHRDGCAY